MIIRKTFLLTALFLSIGVSANSDNNTNFGMQNNANSLASFNYIPNMMAANNWPAFGGANNWLSYNGNANMMQMMGGANSAYMPYNNTMPYMPNNNWGSFSAYNNMMPMMGVNGAMPYTNYNNTMPNNMSMNQANMNTGFGLSQAPVTPLLNNAWGSLDASAAWGLGGDLNSWTQQTQSDDLSSQNPADVIAQLMSGEHAAVYQKIIADAYEKGFADALVQSGAGGICVPTSEELPEFNLEAE